MAIGPDRLLRPWIAAAARDARKRAGRLQVHVAAERGMTEETIRKFESGERWPRDPDLMINAYAEDLGIAPVDLWAEALDRMRKATAR